MSRSIIRVLVFSLLVLVLFSSCDGNLNTPSEGTSTESIKLTPFISPTTTQTLPPADPATNTPLPTPSATPIIHIIKEGETLIVIGARYGVSVDEILAVNPDTDPRSLSIGDELVIPGSANPSAEITVGPTPISLDVSGTDCFLLPGGGLWCLVLVQNRLENAVESISVEFRMVSGNGEVVASRGVAAPLNILQAEVTLPVGVHFTGPLPDTYQVNVELLSALPYNADLLRYTTVDELISQVEISADGLLARADGKALLESSELPIRLSILAVGYDVGGKIVGYRVFRREHPADAGNEVPFEVVVYSLGGAIEHVELYSEAEIND